MDVVVYSGDDEWSALYVDGKLDRVGDHYLADERIRELFGIETVYSDDFMRGGNDRDTVASILDEIEAYKAIRLSAEQKAKELHAQAEELMRQATNLLNQARGVK